MVLRNAPLLWFVPQNPHVEYVHPQNTIDFNPLTRRALAGAEPEKDELRKNKRKTRSVLFIFHNCPVSFVIQPNLQKKWV